MTREVLKIQGMYCENCAGRIETGVKSLGGVIDCRADYGRSEAAVVYDPDKVRRKDIISRIQSLGYEVADDFTRSVQIVSVLLILLALYLIANHLGLLSIFNIFPAVEASMSYGAVFVIGILTSVHCIAMCGGINLTQSVMSAERQEKALRSNLLYNLGRVVSYTLIGGLAGAVGSVLSLGGRWKGAVAVAAGLLMLLMSLRMLGVFKGLRRLRFPVLAALSRRAGKLLRGRSGFVLGLLNGLMPCGPLQSMQVYALSTGSFFGGALSMLLFSLGTVPLMFGFGAIAGRLNRKYRSVMLTVSALLVFVLGLGMVGNGFALSGFSLQAVRSAENLAIVEGDRQIVRSQVDYGSYESITVRTGIPVEWTIYVPEGRLNGCNGEILVQKFGLDVRLREGENIVTFFPEDVGTVPFSCWMGMIRSNINII